MSEYYKANRTKNLYNPASTEPFKLSRSKIEQFMNCPRCFYLDRRIGVGQPPGFPFALNSAVDTLLKKEFDIHRAAQTAHPLMKTYDLNMVPFQHEMIDEWRENFKGIQFHHKATNFIMTGAVDDLWVNEDKEIVVVDYKSTSKPSKVTLDADWQIGYKRQMEMYQWLLRQLGFRVSNTGYFVYANGKTDREAFDGKLDFDIDILPYTGNGSWVEDTLFKIKECLDGEMPESSASCDYCAYHEARKLVK
ncbi:PD-(D/E)XK nuclease family protein [Candidatus Campbellbacteria bacterium]|nr:MAG: PD-(D/E)XK nuclease family protein [Candidatus Campbellbacteria bacterium]